MTLNIASYGSTRTACEFLTDIAYAMEVSRRTEPGNERPDRRTCQACSLGAGLVVVVGQLMGETKPLPEDFDCRLKVAQSRALDALPQFKELIGEVCDTLGMTTRALAPGGGGSARE